MIGRAQNKLKVTGSNFTSEMTKPCFLLALQGASCHGVSGSLGFVLSAASILVFDGNHITCRGRIPQLVFFFYLLITPHLQNNSLHCINWDKIYFDLLCVAPVADFLHLGPHYTVYIAKRIVSTAYFYQSYKRDIL